MLRNVVTTTVVTIKYRKCNYVNKMYIYLDLRIIYRGGGQRTCVKETVRQSDSQTARRIYRSMKETFDK